MTPLGTAFLPTAVLLLSVAASPAIPGAGAGAGAGAGGVDHRTGRGAASGPPGAHSPTASTAGSAAPHVSGAAPTPTPSTTPSPSTDPGRSTPGPSTPTAPLRASGLSTGWDWPLDPPHPPRRVLRPFVAPTSRYGAGHRGLDLEGAPGALIRAVDSGTVSHVGVVAGTSTVTLLHPNGLRSTYQPVVGSVSVGQLVHRGEVIGVLAGGGSHCPGHPCLHLGAVRGTTYLDPLTLLAQSRVRLLPRLP